METIGTWSDGVKIVGKAKDFAFQTIKYNNSFFPIVVGKDVERYLINWGGLYCSRDRQEIEKHDVIDMRLRDEKMFKRKKILIRKTGNEIIAAIDIQNYYNEQSLFSFGLNNVDYHLETILCILNSKFANFLLKENAFSKKETFPQIRLHWLKDFPVPKLNSLDSQKPILDLNDKMLSYKEEIRKQTSRFIKLLQSSFSKLNVNRKIEAWYEMTFGEFRKELEKQKITIAIKELMDYQELFETHAAQIQALRHSIKHTERAIDALVYGLYDLTQAEIAIIEKE